MIFQRLNGQVLTIFRDAINSNRPVDFNAAGHFQFCLGSCGPDTDPAVFIDKQRIIAAPDRFEHGRPAA